LSKLIDCYKDIAYNLAFSVVNNKGDAQDITQESFIKVITNISRFRNESGFTTWLYRIVYNESLQHLRKLKKQNHFDVHAYQEVFYNEDEKKATEERYLVLYEQIDKLSDKDKHIVILFYLAEKTIKEINAITGMSISSIKVNLHRIRKKLSENLKLTHESR